MQGPGKSLPSPYILVYTLPAGMFVNIFGMSGMLICVHIVIPSKKGAAVGMYTIQSLSQQCKFTLQSSRL
jgi:hypothetical protein